MTVADVADGSARPRTGSFQVTITHDIVAACALWERMAQDGTGLALSHRDVLAAWTATIGQRPGLDPLAVTISDGDGRPVMGLPLVRERRGLTRIAFADCGVIDYNAPIVARALPTGAAEEARRLRDALLAALPPADLLVLERMPLDLAGRPNPLAAWPQARPSRDIGLVLDMPGAYADWRQRLPRRFRMELGRCDRLFQALPDARFERVTADGPAVIEALERLQRERFAALGTAYDLDAADVAAFYRRLALDLADGPGVLTALRADGKVVAALFGVRHGHRYIMLRIAAAPAYSQLSPGRLLITATMAHLRAEGVTQFDFGRGDYAYKRKLGAVPLALCDLVAARSPLGLGAVAGLRLKAALRESPALHHPLRRLRDALRRTDPA